MSFARRVFATAGIYGLIVMLPQIFLKPPASPEVYYGFVGAVLAWQVAFLIVAKDPARFRPLIPATWIEKGAFGIAVPLLYLQGRVPAFLMGFAAVDLLWGALFVEAWRRTKTDMKEISHE
jgi:hypothetical protein